MLGVFVGKTKSGARRLSKAEKCSSERRYGVGAFSTQYRCVEGYFSEFDALRSWIRRESDA